VVEGRLRVRLAEWWVLTLLGDVGGFGISSDVAEQAFGGIAYEISETWSLQGWLSSDGGRLRERQLQARHRLRTVR